MDAGEALIVLLEEARGIGPAALASVVRHAGDRLGAAVDVYLVDYEEQVLIPLDSGAEPLTIEGTVAGRAFKTGEPVTVDHNSDGVDVWVCLAEGSARQGVLRFGFPHQAPADPDACRSFTAGVATVLVTKNAYGDSLERVRRRREMDLAAELRWSQLPPRTFANDEVSISGVFEPAYRIAGDCFDYAVNERSAELAVIDAMGHGLEASQVANLAVTSYRHSRRRNLSMFETAEVMDRHVRDQFGPERFSTAQLATLDLAGGGLRVLNCGHPQPLLVRRNKLVGEVPCEPRPPLGFGGFGSLTTVAEVALEPGDVVVFYSDGVIEARSADGDPFGLDRLGDFIIKATLADEKPAETARRLIHSVLDHVGGRLQDDATVVVLGWRTAGS